MRCFLANSCEQAIDFAYRFYFIWKETTMDIATTLIQALLVLFVVWLYLN
jgi:hypothetical protein